MNRYEWLDAYLLSKPGAENDYKIEWQWHRYLIRGQMFAAICKPDIKYKEHNGREMVLLKCDPILAELFRREYAYGVAGLSLIHIYNLPKSAEMVGCKKNCLPVS